MFTEADVRNTMRQYMDASFFDLCAHAKANFLEVLKELSNTLKPVDAALALVEIARVSVRADGELSRKEKMFINNVFTEDFSLIALTDFESSRHQRGTEKALIRIIGALSPNGKGCALNFISTFLAVDGNLDRAEVQYLLRILNGVF